LTAHNERKGPVQQGRPFGFAGYSMPKNWRIN
jgi:hypothetical protein